jgi:ATP-binding cassette subfamily B protein
MAAKGIVSPGNWHLFFISLDRFWFPILNLSAFWAQIQSGLSSAERVFALIDAESTVIQTGSVKLGRLRGEIEFRKVHFEYSSGETVLHDFDLVIRSGETLALVGHTGAGKSSITRLISRFYQFQTGEILVDGRDIRGLDLLEYRQQSGIVT